MNKLKRLHLFYKVIYGVLLLIFSSNVAYSEGNRTANIADFNSVFSQHQQLVAQQKYQAALPLAKQSYLLAKTNFEPLSNNRLVATDNYALNLQVTNNPVLARAVFIELLGLYELKYGKHALELLPILNDITALNTELAESPIKSLANSVDADEAKNYAIRQYKLYLRYNSDDFVKQFADPKLPTTIHAENTLEKLESHLDKDFAIYESDHWSIIYPPEELTYVQDDMSKLMEQTYTNNISFLVAMGLRNKPIDEKMTAVYFSNQADYVSYITAITGDSYAANASGGIYSPSARAIFVFDKHYGKSKKRKRPPEQTIAHEVSHQVLYATGFNALTYVQPRWLIEGTAASFEYHNSEESFGPHTSNYAFRRVLPVKKRFENNSLISLEELIGFDGDDEDFESAYNQSDIYALGAMLVRFLYTYYPDEFKDYLTILSKSRSVLFGKNVRLKQFRKAFGEPEAMQAQFSAYIAQVIAETDIAYAEVQALKKAKKKKEKQEKSARKSKKDILEKV
ncbi:DUF1570 domain-containing protein [Colwellia echini]|nr:DUF1570 domain-containing protein [Colwellia echini]